MALFGRRLRCHFCGTKSKAYKGDTEFRCSYCEAVNFYDISGNIIDTPASVVAATAPAQTLRPQASFARPVAGESKVQSDQPFCTTCLNNQRIYTEALAQYLPDDDDPRYHEYESKFPQYKANLQRRYPQLCKKCAPRAQMLIHKADYHGMLQHTSTLINNTRKYISGSTPRRQRDDWTKWIMRRVLDILGTVVYASLAVQMGWHGYGITTTISSSRIPEEVDSIGFAFDPTAGGCIQEATRLRTDRSCFTLLGTAIPKLLLATLLLLWYNRGLRKIYDHTHRMELVSGQREHFWLQAILLLVRTVAWSRLSDPVVSLELEKQQLLAAHGFMLVFMPLIQWISERVVKWRRWTMRNCKIMPKPEEVDVLGADAGPVNDHYTPKASTTHPLKLFPPEDRPFPMEKLAPKRGYSKLDLNNPPPSPPDSESLSDNGDTVEMDWQPTKPAFAGSPVKSTIRSKFGAQRPATGDTNSLKYGQPSGWGALRHEMSRIESEEEALQKQKRRDEEERAKWRYASPVEPGLFTTRLPPAPMSMERRLRNPPVHAQVRPTPLSKQKDFMQQMRQSVERADTFAEKKNNKSKGGCFGGLDLDDSDQESQPTPKKKAPGSLQVRQGTFTLPSDGVRATGLEDLFGGKSFQIADEPGLSPPVTATSAARWKTILAVMVLVFAMALVWNIPTMRSAVCLWLVSRLEQLGI